ncbi:MAG: RNA polymerase sigma-70 factor [Bacteroidales bacterium]|nr:RNA polymerase sigma-70 factor [Bacteroidales bacterium]
MPNTLNNIEFEELFKEYFKPLVNFSNKFLNDIDAAKEVVHDVFVNLWEKRNEIDPEKSIKSYLYTSVNNRSLNFIRDNKKFVRDEIILQNEQNVENTDTFAESEIQRIIDKTLADLPPKAREVFEMSRYQNLKYREIAEKLGLSQKTVETHMSRALKDLRKNLKEYLTVLLLILLN